MKIILFLLLFTGLSVHAQEFTNFEQGDLHFSSALSELISVDPLCPSNPEGISCRAFGSIVKVRVTMNACLDRFGGHFSKFVERDGKGYLYFGAINIFNQLSATARCVRAPTEIISVSIPFDGPVELVQLDFKGMQSLEN